MFKIKLKNLFDGKKRDIEMKNQLGIDFPLLISKGMSLNILKDLKRKNGSEDLVRFFDPYRVTYSSFFDDSIPDTILRKQFNKLIEADNRDLIIQVDNIYIQFKNHLKIEKLKPFIERDYGMDFIEQAELVLSKIGNSH